MFALTLGGGLVEDRRLLSALLFHDFLLPTSQPVVQAVSSLNPQISSQVSSHHNLLSS